YTVTLDPSLRVMCDSYVALPSASVSTRSMVPPLTFASAAARTFAAVSPVRSVSSERCGGRPACPGPPKCGLAGRLLLLPLPLLLDPLPPDAAPASADPPSAGARTESTISSTFLTVSVIALLPVGDSDSLRRPAQREKELSRP